MDGNFRVQLNGILSLLIIMLLFLASCLGRKKGTGEATQEFILGEKDLIPEGVAIDNRNNTIYIGSTHKRKIVQIDRDGNISDFISSEMDNVWSPIGMEVDEDRDLLWVNTAHVNQVLPLVNPDTTQDWMTGVNVYSLSNKKLIKSYRLNSAGFFNDLTIAHNGDVYITESTNNSIYKISKSEDQLGLFLKPEGFSFLNGITIVDSLNTLFVSSTQGIIHVDLKTKIYFPLNTEKSIDDKGIDGLAYNNHYIIGHQSSTISKFYLDDTFTKIAHVEVLDFGEEFDSSTTGEVGNGYYAYIVNSQIRSGVNYKERKIKPMDSLHNIIIRKKYL